MKCFLLCFSSSKRQNHFSSKPAYVTIQPTHHETDLEESIHWISQSKIENEQEKSQCVNNTTGDIETKEKTLKEEKITTPQCCIIDNHVEEEEECSDSLFSVSITCGKPVSIEENEVNSNHAKDESKSEEQPNEAKDLDEKTRPMNQSNLDLYNEKTGEKEERYSESSLFSLSTDYNNNCRKRISFSSSEGNNDDDACSSVLNPIENFSSQGKIAMKVAKATVLHSGKKDKENMNWNQAETSLKVLSSISSWLVKSENDTPKNVCSNGEDRQILGALKVEEMKKYSSPPPNNVSIKSSTSLLSPEETPIIGNHSEQTRSSKSNKHGKYS
ncbi:hypothetical protein MtrunA17_Chr7g0274491 [Medicago truncatula]|uniref:Uncharacterized protein n=1 Tax=Medicago truncatula TaxID=3880 RepID=A0A072U4B6_MEDTR|nr:uncharacterized protein LOC25499708 isoform X2 [Medicago truncatula]KEH24589.1 hypothetical protein MTR_7g115560 [Medicago truncatula]RHN49436.1 hypothetical protein MtrunA17_Chr7g0274491 [Medicago truncatula]